MREHGRGRGRGQGGAAWHGTARHGDNSGAGGRPGPDLRPGKARLGPWCGWDVSGELAMLLAESVRFPGLGAAAAAVDAAADSPTNQCRRGLFVAHQRQGIRRAGSRHNNMVGRSVVAVGVQQRRNASQGHGARLRGADWGVCADELVSSNGAGAGVGAVRCP
jgi:hypothetical protein